MRDGDLKLECELAVPRFCAGAGEFIEGKAAKTY